MIGLFLTAFSSLPAVLSCICFITSTNLKTSFPALSASFTLLGGLWNGTHIHCLITEGGFSDDGFRHVVRHFNYTLLRKSVQTALLNLLKSRIESSFKKAKALIYHKDKDGFYVYTKPGLCDTDAVIKYISHYPAPRLHKFIIFNVVLDILLSAFLSPVKINA